MQLWALPKPSHTVASSSEDVPPAELLKDLLCGPCAEQKQHGEAVVGHITAVKTTIWAAKCDYLPRASADISNLEELPKTEVLKNSFFTLESLSALQG